MSHFRKFTSPLLTISIAYVYVVGIILLLYLTGFYNGSSFFSWGPPISFFGVNIDTTQGFYMMHALIFVHQLINNCVNAIVYPWIINSIQDPKNKIVEYPDWLCLTIICAFDAYSEIDVVFILGGFTSQISFVLNIILANLITSFIINRKYLTAKHPENLELIDRDKQGEP